VLGLTKALAREQGPFQIRVNAICPGLIDTDIFHGQLSAESRQAIIDATPIGRIGQPQDVAGCALFLASDLSSYVTGSEIDVNGGVHIH
jgi:NAD(P)-dependent dehydrogenase (short-subunit alcohol dehydrogenase family)